MKLLEDNEIENCRFFFEGIPIILYESQKGFIVKDFFILPDIGLSFFSIPLSSQKK